MPVCSNRNSCPVVWAKGLDGKPWPAWVVTDESYQSKKPSKVAAEGHAYVHWLGEDYARKGLEQVKEANIMGFDEGYEYVWRLGASSKVKRVASDTKEKFLRAVTEGLAYQPSARRVEMTVAAMLKLEEEVPYTEVETSAYEQKRNAAMARNSAELARLGLAS